MPHNGLSDRQYSKVAIDARPLTATVARLSNETFVTDKTSDALVTTGEKTSDTAPTQQKTAVISVLLVDEHALMREGLKQLLELEQDLHVVGEAVNGFDALHKVRTLRPDVVLMD